MKKTRGSFLEIGHLVKDALFEFGQKLVKSDEETDLSESFKKGENDALNDIVDEENSTEGDNALDSLMADMGGSEDEENASLDREFAEMKKDIENSEEGNESDDEINLSDEMGKLLEDSDQEKRNELVKSSVMTLLEQLQIQATYELLISGLI